MTDRIDDYRAAVDYATSALKEWLPRSSLDETAKTLLLRLTFQVRRVQSTESIVYLDAPDPSLEQLAERAMANQASRDLFTEIVSSKLLACRPLSKSEKLFAGQALGGRLPKIAKKAGKKGGSRFHQRAVALLIAQIVSVKFGLKLTRNDEVHVRQSACDAVVQAFMSIGNHSMTFDVMKKLIHDEQLAKDVEIVSALQVVQKFRPAAFRKGLSS